MTLRIIHALKKLSAEFHLKHICPRCSHHKQQTRDILHNNKCFWKDSWEKGNYDIPRGMGLRNFIRLYILKRPIRVRIKGKIYEAEKV
jgi:hypothetical protein